MKEENNDLDLLLTRVLNREANPQEIAFFCEWIRQKENRLYFDKLKKVWNLTAGGHVDTESLQNGLQDYRRFMQKSAAAGKRPNYFWRYLAAAVMLSFIATSALWMFREKQQHVPFSQNSVKERQVVLTLADGKKVNLSSDTILTLTSNGQALEISKKQQWEITYKAKGEPTSDTLLYNEITVPDGKRFSVKLPDSTKVWLNAGSSLRYPLRFGKSGRSVEASGNVYFEVTKDPARPFFVHTPVMKTEVLGTSFEINTYGDRHIVSATLVEGCVRVSVAGYSAVIRPNQQFAYNTEDGKTSVLPVDAAALISWKDGILRIDNEPLEMMFRKLERWYGVGIKNETEISRERFFQGEFTKENLRTVMEVISANLGVSYTIKNDSVFIRK